MIGLLVIFLAMLACLAVAGLVVAYVAYPHRGEAMPKAPWLGDALARTVSKAPTLDKR